MVSYPCPCRTRRAARRAASRTTPRPPRIPWDVPSLPFWTPPGDHPPGEVSDSVKPRWNRADWAWGNVFVLEDAGFEGRSPSAVPQFRATRPAPTVLYHLPTIRNLRFATHRPGISHGGPPHLRLEGRDLSSDGRGGEEQLRHIAVSSEETAVRREARRETRRAGPEPNRTEPYRTVPRRDGRATRCGPRRPETTRDDPRRDETGRDGAPRAPRAKRPPRPRSTYQDPPTGPNGARAPASSTFTLQFTGGNGPTHIPTWRGEDNRPEFLTMPPQPTNRP